MSAMTVYSRFTKEETRRPRLGITRGQALLFLISFSLFFYLLTELVFASSGRNNEPLGKEVTVRAGDSLWKLAVRYQEEAEMGVNELVFAIKEANGLDSVIIYPGQTLIIPLPDKTAP